MRSNQITHIILFYFIIYFLIRKLYRLMNHYNQFVRHKFKQMGQQQTKQLKQRITTAIGEHNDTAVEQLIHLVQTTAHGDRQDLLQKTLQYCKTVIQSQSPQELTLKKQPSIKLETPIDNVFDSQIASITNIENKICSTIVEIMSTRKLYHIREHFRKLALSILGLENAEFYVFHDSGRIEYHGFRENYITQVLEENYKRKIIQHVLANTAQAVQNVEIVKSENSAKWLQKSQNNKRQKSQQFSKLFSLTSQSHNQCHGHINKQNEKYSILSLLTFPQSMPVGETINEKIIQKLIKISMIEIEEETEYDIIQFYSKQLLDVLGLIVGESQQRIKRRLKDSAERQKNEQFTAKTDDIEKLSLLQLVKQSSHHSQTIHSPNLISQSLKYQQFRFQLLERIRMYSKYLCEDNVIFMDFDEQGRLYFMSNNRKNSQFQSLFYNLSLSDELCIEKIFLDNNALQLHIKKSLEGQAKNKKLYEIGDGLKARVVLNDLDEIERIMVMVEDPPIILSHGSFSSSTLEGVSSNNNNKRKNGSTGSDSVSLGKGSKGSASLIKALEKQNPGITANGWLNLFIKDHQLKRHSSKMIKKKQTLFARGQQGSRSIKNIADSLNYEQIELFQTMDITSPDMNLLSLEQEYLEPFVKKVFSQLKYFNTLEHNKEHFDNFLFHLHQGYQLHENTFHNFTHGVNVMHTCFIICGIQKNQQILSPIKFFSTVLSGLCHDVGHTGRTNSFEIASRSKKAITYNDLSPLENFHASYTFEILRRPQNNFLQSLSLDEYNEIRKDIISNILYTDIKEHFPLIKKFKAIQYKPEEKPLSTEDVRTLTGMITHTSDFGGSAKEFEICKEWSRRVNIEFIAQYKQQEELGIAQTPFFKDLEVESIMAKNEMGFLKVIVFPLYEALNQFYHDEGSLKKLKAYADDNISLWQKVHISSSTVNINKVEEKEKTQN